MDPLSLGIAGIGLGLKIFGGLGAMDDSKKVYEQEQKIAGFEQKINEQKQQAMELSARRQQMEIFRNTQRARAQNLAVATTQGASYGSGLQGGLAEATASGFWNATGVSQNLQIGRNIFGLDTQISQAKIQEAQYKSDLATDQGWASLGGSIMSSAGTIGNIFGAGQSFLSNATTFNKGGFLFQD